MSQARVAAGMDRLPWLADEPAPPRKRGNWRELAGWAVAATLLVAGASYWMGARTRQQPGASPQTARSSTSMPLPTATEPPQPQVILEPPPQVTPAPQRQVSIARPRAEKRALVPADTRPAPASEPQAAQVPAVEVAPPLARTAPAPAATPLTAWPAWQSKGAAGRIVRIGAFGSRLQAKLGWRYMVRAYPAVAHLQAIVVQSRNSRGRAFFRFQIGTTSQAHSEVLCQRMEKIHLSCAVVGLPWKPKGVER